MRASSSAVRGPVVSQPDRSVSATASISASEIAGGWNERNSVRLEESSGIRGEEAYALRGGVRRGDGLLPGAARPEHGPGAVGAAPQRDEDVAGLAVDPCLDPGRDLDGLERPGRGDEETRH